MRLPFKQLKSLPVRTVSGILLGRIQDIVLETEGQLVAQYRVKPSVLMGKEYLVGRDQIVRIDADALIVDDAVLRTGISPEKKRQTLTPPEPVVMRKES